MNHFEAEKGWAAHPVCGPYAAHVLLEKPMAKVEQAFHAVGLSQRFRKGTSWVHMRIVLEHMGCTTKHWNRQEIYGMTYKTWYDCLRRPGQAYLVGVKRHWIAVKADGTAYDQGGKDRGKVWNRRVMDDIVEVNTP